MKIFLFVYNLIICCISDQVFGPLVGDSAICLSNMMNIPLSCVMCMYGCIGCGMFKYWDWK